MTEKELAQHFPMLEPELLVEMSKVAEVRTFSEGEKLMRSGQNIRYALLVLDGRIKIYREDELGNEYFVYFLGAGQACAVSLACSLGQETSGLMARADSPASVISIPVNYVDSWMGQYKSWAQFALTSYRQRFDELLEAIDHIAFRNMDERLVFYLKRHCETMKSKTLVLPFTEIAADLNSSREVISRLMKKLAEKGVVKLHRTHIEILDIETPLV